MDQQERIRLAVRLQQQWQRGVERQWEELVPLSDLLRPYLKRLRQAEEQWSVAYEKDFSLAEPLLLERVQRQARSLRITLQDLESEHFPARQMYLLADFYQDLVQLEEEFPCVRVNWQTSQLMVETEPIVLNDLDLGPFSIRLNWNDWTLHRDLHSLQVIAVEPHPAELHEEVTHPHVRDGELCSGDAQDALLKALRQGRLAEAFLLIRAVLTHYNPRSAYVSLENWHGTACQNCGISVSDDDRSYCEACENDFCPECSDSCASCGACRCLRCLDTCDCCEDRCCPGCLETTATEQSLCQSCRVTCPGCDQLYGPGDLQDDTGLCQDCTLPPHEESIDVSTRAASTT